MTSLQKESEWENTKKAFLKELKQALQNNIPHAVDTEFSKFLPAVETAIDTIVSTREKEIAEEVPNALHEYARWILTDGKNAGPLQRRGKKKEITLQILKHLYKSNSSGLPIADNRMQLGISRVKSAEDYQKYGIKPDSDVCSAMLTKKCKFC